MNRDLGTLTNLILATNDNPDDILRQGVVTAVVGATVTVRIGAAATPVAGLRHMAWYTPTAGDVVMLIRWGHGYLVLGTLA